MFGFLDDLENAFIQGGGNGIAKYLSKDTFNIRYHLAIPLGSKSSDLTLKCYLRWPYNVFSDIATPGIPPVMGRPLFLMHEGEEEMKKTEKATLASVKCVSRSEADGDGWVCGDF